MTFQTWNHGKKKETILLLAYIADVNRFYMRTLSLRYIEISTVFPHFLNFDSLAFINTISHFNQQQFYNVKHLVDNLQIP